MRRRAVGLRGFLYFVRTHTRPTVPRDRSAAALGGDGTVANTLIPWHGIRLQGIREEGREGVTLTRVQRAVRGESGDGIRL